MTTTTKPWHGDAMKVPDHDARCTMFVSFLFCPAERCENASTHLVRAACVHEHVFEYAVCERCARAHESQRMLCNACTDSSESHECPLRLTVSEIGGAA